MTTRTRFSTLLAGIAALAFGSIASAAIYTDVELPPAGYALVNAANPYNFTFNVGPYGAGEVVQSAQLRVWLADDSTDTSENWWLFGLNIDWQQETASFTLDGVTTIQGGRDIGGGLCGLGLLGNGANPACLNSYDLFSMSVPTSLLADGSLGVRVNATSGDFWFKRADLTVNTARVPEPATLGLLGLGLVGMGLVRRRRSVAA